MEKRHCITLLVASRKICFAGLTLLRQKRMGRMDELLFEGVTIQIDFLIHMIVKVLHLSLSRFEGHLVASCY